MQRQDGWLWQVVCLGFVRGIQSLACKCRYMPLISAVESTQVPHAIILGNHDAEARMTRSAVIALDASCASSRTPLPEQVPGIPDAGNYWLDVWAESGEAPALRLWMLDTMDRDCGGVPGWCGAAPVDAVLPHTMSASLPFQQRHLCCKCLPCDSLNGLPHINT